jgi:FtsH-binding integral membrane protein
MSNSKLSIKEFLAINSPQIFSIILLSWALYPQNPYGYYIFLRIICCLTFAYIATRFYYSDKLVFMWIMVSFGILYNPVIRIHLNREIWSVINIITIVVIVLSLFLLRDFNNK